MVKSNYKVIGVMSGTSLDGIDIIYTEYSFNRHWSFKIYNAKTYTYSKYWKNTLGQLTNFSKTELEAIDKDYSTYLGEIIKLFTEEFNILDIDFVSSHGHTALHQPKRGLTYQIGNLKELANEVNLKAICNFRVQDVELGGQGAPLVPIGDKLLFGKYDYCLNLGGFANISFQANENRIAFDICPVNIVLNHYVKKMGLEYDAEGKISKSGYIHSKLLDQLNALDFYNQKPPKSLGLEWVIDFIFPVIERYHLSIEDILRTFIEHIAIQISKYLNQNNKTVFITGGGAYNLFLIERLRGLTKTKIIIPKNDIIEYKEALIFGFLGVLKERNEVNCLSSVTGASKDHSSGCIFDIE